MPIVGLVTISGIVVGILNAHDQFTIPALAPVAWNPSSSAGSSSSSRSSKRVRGSSSTRSPRCSARSSSSSCPCRGCGVSTGGFAPSWTGDPAVKRFFVLMLPVTLTLGLININIFVNMLFASRLVDPDLAPAAIEKAFRVYMLPQGMFSVAVATVLFPTLSRFAAVGNLPVLPVDARQRPAPDRVLAPLPAGAVAAVLAQPIVRLLYERGAFTAANTVVVAQCLAAFSLGLMFNGWMLLLSRGFYSLQRNWVPTAVALGTVGLNAVLNAFLYRVGVWGIPWPRRWSTSSGSGCCSSPCAGAPASPRRGSSPPRSMRILVASGIAAAAAFGAWWLLDDLLGRSLLAQIVSLGAGLAPEAPSTSPLRGSWACASSRRCAPSARQLAEGQRSARRPRRATCRGLRDALLAGALGELARERLELSAERPAEEEVGELGVPRQQRAVEVRAEDVALHRAVGRRLAAVADADLDLGERLGLGAEDGPAPVPFVADERRQAEPGGGPGDDPVVHVLAHRRAHVEQAEPSVVTPAGGSKLFPRIS